jgi:hypothetical protein
MKLFVTLLLLTFLVFVAAKGEKPKPKPAPDYKAQALCAKSTDCGYCCEKFDSCNEVRLSDIKVLSQSTRSNTL